MFRYLRKASSLLFLSPTIGRVRQVWPVCLWAVAATYDLSQEAEKCTLSQPATVHAPRSVPPLLERNGGCRLTSGRLGKYQATPPDTPNVTLQVASTLKPATLLPRTTGEPAHDCIQITEYNLTDEPLENLEMEIFTDASSFTDEAGLGKAGCTAVAHQEALEAEAPVQVLCPEGRAHSPHRPPSLGAKEKVTIYTNSKFAFSVPRAHGATWKDWSTDIRRKEIQHAEEIPALLDAVLYIYTHIYMYRCWNK